TAKVLSLDTAGAMVDLNKCIELDPNDALAYLNRGGIKSDEKDQTGACADWTKSSALGNKLATDLLKEYCK
ncbi:MAG TPA: hypothetical protein VHC47_03000, partial [Mucilaginibacter sp.]|nr:hypothetical protein [Mucilaginibacter sp.]